MTQIKLRRDVSAAWTSSNPILGSGEPGFETDTGKFKIGDGSTNWNNLAYSNTLPDLSNLSDAGKIVAAGASMPSQTTISLTLGASGTSYTMPADGWLHVTLALNINGFLGVGAVYAQSGTANGGYASVFKPVRKGETLGIAYEQKASVVRFQFIYAKGSESEAS